MISPPGGASKPLSQKVLRLLVPDLEPLEQEDHAILQAGLISSPYLTVDDSGTRHARRPGVTTQIGGERFTVFRTSRLPA